MPRASTSNGRPRAIAVPNRTHAPWQGLALGLTTLLLLLMAAGAARAQDARSIAAVADELGHAATDLRSRPVGPVTPAVAVTHDEHHAFTRPTDRTRRAAGRAGVPVRRDGRAGGALLPTTAVLDRITIGGPAPFGTPAANTPPSRGTTVHGVRGPPSLSSQAG